MTADRRIPPRREPSDLALVEAARLDRDAFAGLYERHVDRVFRFAVGRLRDADLAADATAIAFSRAYASLDRFTPGNDASFGRWLMTITRNVVVDTVRERSGVVPLDPDALAQVRAASGADPAQALPPDDRQRIEDAIRELGSPQREIVVLRLQGWTGVEIAQVLGMTHGAVRVAQHRAYARLRDRLAHIRSSVGEPENGAAS